MIRHDDDPSMPTREYAARASECNAEIRRTGRPLFLTSDGRTEAVVLGPDAYEELLDQSRLPEILAASERSRADHDAGRGTEAIEGIRRIAERHGVELDR